MTALAALVDLRQPCDLALSPDGTLAFALRHASSDRAGAERSDLWTLAPGAPEPRQLTDGPSADAQPRWSPDGRALAFLSDADAPGRAAPWIAEDERPPRRLAAPDATVEQLAWTADGERLLLLCAGEGADAAGVRNALPHARSERAAPDVARGGADASGRRTLAWLSVADGRIEPLGPARESVWEFDLGADGTLAALVSEDPTESGWYDARLALVDPASGTPRTLHRPAAQAQCPRVSPDGAAVALIEGPCSDRGIVCGAVTLIDVASGAARELAVGVDVAWLAWSGPDRLAYVARDGLACELGTLTIGAPRRPLWRGARSFGAPYEPQVALAPQGDALAVASETATAPPELFTLADGGGDDDDAWTRRSAFNARLGAPAGVAVEPHAWAAPDGERIAGLLIRREDLAPRAPGIVLVHGGPTATWAHSFTALRSALLLAEHGYAVLAPNPRGSSGRGAAFAAAAIGDMGGADLADLLAGVDELVARDVLDPDRVGISGRSYGGFMTAWAATRTDRFAAAVAVACVSDWVSFLGTSNVARFAELFLPWRAEDGWEHAIARSPALGADGCRTPTLILHGAGDRCTPVGQAQELYAALARAGAERELVVYPGEGHFLLEREHQLDAFERTRDWFDRFLR